MKIVMNRLARGEKGQAMILAVVLLIVGGLIVSSLLSYMGNGLFNGRVYERGTAELYAADAGVEDAVWKIQQGIGLCPGNPSTTYNITDVNGKSVEVTITYVNNQTGSVTYKITSIATTDSNSHTTVESYVKANMLYNSFFDNAITSNGTVEIGSNSIVNGNVTYGTSISGTVNGTATKEYYANWPSCSDLANLYLSQVQNATDPGSPIDVGGGTVTKGPCKRNGDLHIKGKGGTLKLTGTFYVTGSLYCDQTGQGYTINLNGQTIFVLGTADFPANHVTVTGSGCIIACGNINFQPGIMTNPNDFVFVMSVTGKVNFQPNGNFYGSVVGDVDVNLQPNNTLTWHSLGGTSLNFPIETYRMQTVTGAMINSWVSQ